MSKIEVDAIDKQSGSTLTLGGSGTAVTLACGATQTGFGRTGTVDWQTGSIKTATFTAANGEGYFANTSGSSFNMNLPAGVAGAIVSVADYGDNFANNALTIVPNGSDKLSGETGNAVLSTTGQSVTLVFVDSTEGWVTVNDSTENVKLNPNIIASGGTVTCSGNCKIHTFTGPGTFTVSNISTTPANNTISYLVVGGGGGGGADNPACTGGGGAGAGGFREAKSPITPYTASPLDGYPTPGNRITLTATSFPITVGGGAAGKAGTPVGACNTPVTPSDGNPSTFSIITSAGGGGGATNNGGPGPSSPTRVGGPGGSGGGSTYYNTPGFGTGNTPPVSPAQGTNGGAGSPSSGNAYMSGGGGGATDAGSGGNPGGGDGGDGATTGISGSNITYAGGGGAGFYGPVGPRAAGQGGPGGGGTGGQPPTGGRPAQGRSDGSAGSDNTGGGGGGGTGAHSSQGGGGASGGNGGSGVVIIRYKAR